ncbi:MAG: hypothetical protein KDJ77_04245 [Rhodobiaceae bacterium]|nr:hypothetical protein [Rhodobiaceae bacterium]
MLKGIPPILTPDLIRILDEMGHGDELVLADRNFPAASVAAETVTGELIQLKGVDDTEAAEAIFALMPIDSYVDEPIRRMEMDGEPDTILEAHADIKRVAEAAEGRPVTVGSIERQAFYGEAKKAYAVVQTSETRPYANFIIKKGIIPA